MANHLFKRAKGLSFEKCNKSFQVLTIFHFKRLFSDIVQFIAINTVYAADKDPYYLLNEYIIEWTPVLECKCHVIHCTECSTRKNTPFSHLTLLNLIKLLQCIKNNKMLL